MKPEAGFSILELIVASFLGLLATLGVLYMYHSQHRNMSVQGAITDMRMNGQFTLNELQHYVKHAGLGLPGNLPSLVESGPDLVVRLNMTKKFVRGTQDASGSGAQAVYRIAAADTALFSQRAYVAVLAGGTALQAEIMDVAPRPGEPTEGLLSLRMDKDALPAATLLYPLERLRLHVRPGPASDSVEGAFMVLQENPGIRAGLRQDSLILAEGIESLSYRFFMADRDSLNRLPAKLDSLLRIEIRVIAKSLIRDRGLPGDGFRRDTLVSRVNYRRTL